ncbi:hypothetical protein ABIB24_003538 [Pseudomonas sp. UYEF17]
MVTSQQMWERACPAKRRAGGARYHRRRNCYGEHLEAFMQTEAKPSLLHTQLSIIHQPGDGHNPSTLTVPARDAGFDAEQRMGTVLALVESGLANGEPGSSVVIVQSPGISLMPGSASSRACPLPQDHHRLQDLHRTCGSGRARERARSGDISMKSYRRQLPMDWVVFKERGIEGGSRTILSMA